MDENENNTQRNTGFPNHSNRENEFPEETLFDTETITDEEIIEETEEMKPYTHDVPKREPVVIPSQTRQPRPEDEERIGMSRYNEVVSQAEEITHRAKQEMLIELRHARKEDEIRQSQIESQLARLIGAVGKLTEKIKEVEIAPENIENERLKNLATGDRRYTVKIRTFAQGSGRPYMMPIPGMTALKEPPSCPDDIHDAREAYGDGRIFYVYEGIKKSHILDCRELDEFGPPFDSYPPKGDPRRTEEALDSKLIRMKRQILNEEGEGRGKNDSVIIQLYKEQLEKMEEKYNKMEVKLESIQRNGNDDEDHRPRRRNRDDDKSPIEKALEEKAAKLLSETPPEYIARIKAESLALGLLKDDGGDDKESPLMYIKELGKLGETLVDKYVDTKMAMGGNEQEYEGKMTPAKDTTNEVYMSPDNRKQLRTLDNFLRKLSLAIKSRKNLTPLVNSVMTSSGGALLGYKKMLTRYATIGYTKSIGEFDAICSAVKKAKNIEEGDKRCLSSIGTSIQIIKSVEGKKVIEGVFVQVKNFESSDDEDDPLMDVEDEDGSETESIETNDYGSM